jgi:flagellar basal body L-ring protein FlgH
MELKKAFPDNPYETHASTDSKDAKDTKDAKPPEAKAVADTKSPAGKEDGLAPDSHDKISSVVVEEINREHLLIKGRKNVLFKNRKRMVEVQALVSRKDIGDDDTISSDVILETNVVVVK